MNHKCTSSRKYAMKYCPIHGVFYFKRYPHDCEHSELPKVIIVQKPQGWKKGRK